MQSCRVPQEEYSNLFRDVRLLGGIQNRKNRDTQKAWTNLKELIRCNKSHEKYKLAFINAHFSDEELWQL